MQCAIPLDGVLFPKSANSPPDTFYPIFGRIGLSSPFNGTKKQPPGGSFFGKATADMITDFVCGILNGFKHFVRHKAAIVLVQGLQMHGFCHIHCKLCDYKSFCFNSHKQASFIEFCLFLLSDIPKYRRADSQAHRKWLPR